MLHKLYRAIVFKILNTIQYGTIVLIENQQEFVFGKITSANPETVRLYINHPHAYQKIVFGGSVGAGTSYINGEWHSDNLQLLLELFLRNANLFKHIESFFSYINKCARFIRHQVKRNTLKQAKNNILAHYDLSNEFFQLFLDHSMMYSSAVFDPLDCTLEQAAKHKLDLICQKLELKPGDHILEIGTGWGGFAIHAAIHYGCKVTTTTISDKQYLFVKNKLHELQLENQIELLNQDYRTLTGEYDKLVSIEMIEAVGHHYFEVFFKQCNHLLKKGGLFLLQAIVINDEAYYKAKHEIDFIKHYIFPGGCLPSNLIIFQSLSKLNALQLISFTDLGMHYVRTLHAWSERFQEQRVNILKQGFNDCFLRTWQYYFAYCAAGFNTTYISVIHAVWRKRL